MLEIVLLGINHKTAPVELRECLAFSEEETDSALASLSNNPAMDEILLFGHQYLQADERNGMFGEIDVNILGLSTKVKSKSSTYYFDGRMNEGCDRQDSRRIFRSISLRPTPPQRLGSYP